MAKDWTHNRYIRRGLSGIVVVLSLATAQLAIAQVERDDAHQKRIKKLIRELVSPNKEPAYSGAKDEARRVAIPDGYDRLAQVRVLESWQSLLDEGLDAFPALVAAHNDRRYSCTIMDTTGDGEWNYKVGVVCECILRNHVDAICCKLKNPDGPNMIWHRAAVRSGFDEDLEKWWAERKNRSLLELQIDCASDAINILKSEIEEPDKRDAEFAIERRAHIKQLESLIRQVTASGKPLLPTGIENRFCRMIGLPDDPALRRHLSPHPYRRDKRPANTE